MEGSWKLMSDMEDPELKALARKPPTTILHSRADSTVKKYLGAFRRWKTWATSHNLVPIPAKPHEVALYLQHLGDRTQSKSAAKEACNALSWIHSSAGITSLSTHPFVKAALEGLKRTHARPVVKKEPLTVEMPHPSPVKFPNSHQITGADRRRTFDFNIYMHWSGAFWVFSCTVKKKKKKGWQVFP